MADDWKYAIDDFEDGDDATDGDGSVESADQATDVFGEAGTTDIEPGSPTLENTLFVCLGVAVALVVILGV